MADEQDEGYYQIRDDQGGIHRFPTAMPKERAISIVYEKTGMKPTLPPLTPGETAADWSRDPAMTTAGRAIGGTLSGVGKFFTEGIPAAFQGARNVMQHPVTGEFSVSPADIAQNIARGWGETMVHGTPALEEQADVAAAHAQTQPGLSAQQQYGIPDSLIRGATEVASHTPLFGPVVGGIGQAIGTRDAFKVGEQVPAMVALSTLSPTARQGWGYVGQGAGATGRFVGGLADKYPKTASAVGTAAGAASGYYHGGWPGAAYGAAGGGTVSIVPRLFGLWMRQRAAAAAAAEAAANPTKPKTKPPEGKIVPSEEDLAAFEADLRAKLDQATQRPPTPGEPPAPVDPLEQWYKDMEGEAGPRAERRTSDTVTGATSRPTPDFPAQPIPGHVVQPQAAAAAGIEADLAARLDALKRTGTGPIPSHAVDAATASHLDDQLASTARAETRVPSSQLRAEPADPLAGTSQATTPFTRDVPNPNAGGRLATTPLPEAINEGLQAIRADLRGARAAEPVRPPDYEPTPGAGTLLEAEEELARAARWRETQAERTARALQAKEAGKPPAPLNRTPAVVRPGNITTTSLTPGQIAPPAGINTRGFSMFSSHAPAGTPAPVVPPAPAAAATTPVDVPPPVVPRPATPPAAQAAPRPAPAPVAERPPVVPAADVPPPVEPAKPAAGKQPAVAAKKGEVSATDVTDSNSRATRPDAGGKKWDQIDRDVYAEEARNDPKATTAQLDERVEARRGDRPQVNPRRNTLTDREGYIDYVRRHQNANALERNSHIEATRRARATERSAAERDKSEQSRAEKTPATASPAAPPAKPSDAPPAFEKATYSPKDADGVTTMRLGNSTYRIAPDAGGQAWRVEGIPELSGASRAELTDAIRAYRVRNR